MLVLGLIADALHGSAAKQTITFLLFILASYFLHNEQPDSFFEMIEFMKTLDSDLGFLMQAGLIDFETSAAVAMAVAAASNDT